MRRIEARDLALHLARIAASAIVLAATRSPWLAGPASLALFFASFALAHDLAHGALGLPRRANDVALAAAGALMLTSGHALRRMHLRHHARPLEEGDLEGLGARLTLQGALAAGPANAIELRVEAWRGAPHRERAWQLAEMITTLAIAAACLAAAPRAIALYVALAIALHATASLWASHIPHNTPAIVLRMAERLAFTRSPVMLSLAFHERHHAHPRIPCQQLARR
jgi:fatty acid desaturase